jgi:hypothetical protein
VMAFGLGESLVSNELSTISYPMHERASTKLFLLTLVRVRHATLALPWLGVSNEFVQTGVAGNRAKIRRAANRWCSCAMTGTGEMAHSLG